MPAAATTQRFRVRDRADKASWERSLTAILRWRTRQLHRALPPPLRHALRLFPMLMAARFPDTLFTGEPACIRDLRPVRRAGELARALKLPSPTSIGRGKATVGTVLASWCEGALEILVLLEPGLTAAERQETQTRAVAVGRVLQQHSLPIQVTAQSVESVNLCSERWLRLVLSGGLVVGRLPSSLLAELQSEDLAIDPDSVIALAERAPSEFSALALMLLCGGRPRAPVAAIHAAMRSGTTCQTLADPDLTCALWASHERALGSQLYAALALSTHSVGVRAAALRMCGPADQATVTAAQVVALGRALAGRCAQAIRRAGIPRSSSLRRRLKEEVLAPGIPSALLPALGRFLEDSDAVEIRGKRTLLERKRSTAHEVWHASGVRLGAGRDLPQARIRALSLIVRALGRLPRGGLSAGKVWQSIGAELRSAAKQRTLIAVFRSEPHSGAPGDPLNRSTARRVALRPVLTVLLRPGARPSSRTMRPVEAIKRVLLESARGTRCEIVSDEPASQPAALRIGRLLRHWSQPAPQDLVAVVEVGGQVLMRTPTGLRQLSLRHFSQRPRRAQIDPEAPDLPTVVRPAISRTEVIDCCVLPLSSTHAQVVYIDARQLRVREEVPLDELETWLQETRDLLRSLRQPAMMPVRIDPEIEQLEGRRTLPEEGRLSVAMGGRLPFGVWVEVDHERFGGGRALGWEAAALTLLSEWPGETLPRVAVRSSSIGLQSDEATAIFHLYARSLLLRRLARHFRALRRT